jgi:hypothetical protein
MPKNLTKYHGSQARKWVQEQIQEKQIPTFPALASALGVRSKDILAVLENPRHEAHDAFSDVVQQIEASMTDVLIRSPKGVGGIAFALKQPPFNWSDKQTIDVQDRRIVEIVSALTREQRLEYIRTGKLPSFVQK